MALDRRRRCGKRNYQSRCGLGGFIRSKAYKAFWRGALQALIPGFSKELIDLVYFMASQINGCIVQDMHARDLRKLDISLA
jgi:Carboxymuconolactone decarboxylase family